MSKRALYIVWWKSIRVQVIGWSDMSAIDSFQKRTSFTGVRTSIWYTIKSSIHRSTFTFCCSHIDLHNVSWYFGYRVECSFYGFSLFLRSFSIVFDEFECINVFYWTYRLCIWKSRCVCRTSCTYDVHIESAYIVYIFPPSIVCLAADFYCYFSGISYTSSSYMGQNIRAIKLRGV